MATYTPTATLCLKTIQHAVNKGWPNKPEGHGLQRDVELALSVFNKEQGRDLKVTELELFVGIRKETLRLEA